MRKSRTKRPVSKFRKTRRHRNKKAGWTKRKNSRKHLRKTRRRQRGGFGNGACPFVGPPWNSTDGGRYFKLGTPIGVGGTPPYPGTVSPSPQHPFRDLPANFRGGSAVKPLTPQPLVNAYRDSLGGIQNIYRQWQGLRPLPSPSPTDQPLQQDSSESSRGRETAPSTGPNPPDGPGGDGCGPGCIKEGPHNFDLSKYL